MFGSMLFVQLVFASLYAVDVKPFSDAFIRAHGGGWIDAGFACVVALYRLYRPDFADFWPTFSLLIFFALLGFGAST